MSAASTFSPESTEGRPAEPSMEDILASIRRIIADDQSHGGKAATAGNAARRAAPDADRAGASRARSPYDDVLDLARLVPSADRASAPEQPHEPPADETQSDLPALQQAADDVDCRQVEDGEGGRAMASLRAQMPEPSPREAAQDEDDRMLDHPVPALGDESEGDLLSAPLGASVMSAFETLAATVVLQNTPMLERVMRDLLRPMLKTWLDDNLPGLVERLVRGEIERVARGTHRS